MKKTLVGLLTAMLLALSLAGCARGGTSAASPSSPAAPEAEEERPLTEEELASCAEFLNRADVNGFLMSNYEDPRDADLTEVFYNGAGIGQEPTEEQLSAFLEANGWEEAYIDITVLPPQGIDEVLQRVAGISLADTQGLPYEQYPGFDVYFHAAGDTNFMPVECLSGTRYPDGTMIVESRESYPWLEEEEQPSDDDASTSTFRTTLRQEGDTLRIAANQVTGGWLADYLAWKVSDAEEEALYLPRPLFAREYDPSLADTTLLVTLTKASEAENGVSAAEEWASANWDTWSQTEDFIPGLAEVQTQYYWDADYVYDITGGQYLTVYDAGSGDRIFSLDFEEYLYPEGATAVAPPLDGIDAQELCWARYYDGVLYVANAHRTYASASNGRTAFVTAIDPWSGEVIWRSDPLVCNSRSFVIIDQVLVCGYGFTDEDDYIYELSLPTGKVVEKLAVATAPDHFLYAGGRLYVHCYDRDYIFDVSFG